MLNFFTKLVAKTLDDLPTIKLMTASTSNRSKTGRKKYRITTLMICEPLLSSFTISIASADKVQNLDKEFIVRELKCEY